MADHPSDEMNRRTEARSLMKPEERQVVALEQIADALYWLQNSITEIKGLVQIKLK